MEKKTSKNNVVKIDQKKENTKKSIILILVIIVLFIIELTLILVNKEKEDKYSYSTKIYCYESKDSTYCDSGYDSAQADNTSVTIKEVNIKCKTKCESLNINNEYVLVKEENSSFIYDIKNNKRVFDNLLIKEGVTVFENNNDQKPIGMELKSEDGKYGYFDYSTKKLILSIEYDSIEYTADSDIIKYGHIINSKMPYVVVKKDNKYAIINIITGKKTLDYINDKITISDEYNYFIKTINKKDYLIDEKGNLVLSKKSYSKIYNVFKDANKIYVLVNTGTEISLVDINGNLISKLQDWKNSYSYKISEYIEKETGSKVVVAYNNESNLCTEKFYSFNTKKITETKYKNECMGYPKAW